MAGCQRETATEKAKVTFGEEELAIPLMKGGSTDHFTYSVGEWYGKEVIGYYNRFENCVELYSIENQDSVARIPIAQEGPNGIGTFTRFNLIGNQLYAVCDFKLKVINKRGAVVDQSDWKRFNDDKSSTVKSYRLHYALPNNNLSSHQPQDSFFYLNFIRKDIFIHSYLIRFLCDIQSK